MSLLTLNLCNIVGWRLSYKICGGFGICVGILGLIFVQEPSREEEPIVTNENILTGSVVHDSDEEDNILKPERLTHVKNKDGFFQILGKFCSGFGKLFTNQTACWILLATCYRVWSVQMIVNYLPKYMEIYPD